MAVQVFLGTFDEQSIAVTEMGYEGLVETAKVIGLDWPDTSLRGLQAIYAPKVPRRGDFHPKIRTMRVNVVTSDMTGPSQADLQIVYIDQAKYTRTNTSQPSSFTRPRWSVQTTLTTVTRDYMKVWDHNNNGFIYEPIEIKYVPAALRIKVPASGTLTSAQKAAKAAQQAADDNSSKATYNMQVPMSRFTYQRVEVKSPGRNARTYVGTLNAWPVFGDPPRTWLCLGISGEPTTGGVNATNYDVRYEFQQAPPGETWDTTLMHIYNNSDRGKDLVRPLLRWQRLPDPPNQNNIRYRNRVSGWWWPVLDPTTSSSDKKKYEYGGVRVGDYLFKVTNFNNLNLYF